jgi:L-fuconolactonase
MRGSALSPRGSTSRDPDGARARLDRLAQHPKFRGIRHLIHEEADPHWILRANVRDTIAVLEDRGLVLELVCVYPLHLGDVPELAHRFPNLRIVIDHLGKPPLATERMGDWAALLSRAAELPNVYAKVSGLNTMLASRDWTGSDLEAAVQVAVDRFGAHRLMCGSDWPVSLLNGDYAKVWRETVAAITVVAGEAAARRILEDTPVHVYGIAEATGAVSNLEAGEPDGRPH